VLDGNDGPARAKRRTTVTENGTNGWRLGRRERVSAGEVAYEVFGEGPPVILVHGTPMWSYLWRNIVPALVERRSVYVYWACYGSVDW
jgi:pimeloyl-ACP methyl ester carboxylesterase